ncbi:MAG: DUF6785 family protein [Candidatus Poribacteria bacterium]
MRLKYLRAVFIALIWIAFQSATGGYIHGNSLGQMVANHMPLGGLFFLIILVFLVNPFLRKLSKGFAPGRSEGMAFSAAELALIWIMIAASSAVPGYGMMEFLFPYLASPLRFATQENQWMETIIPHLPKWSYLADKRAVEDFFTGFSGDEIPWRAWLAPAGFWITFALLFFFVFTCWSVLLRRQWVERERYVFPLVQIPAYLVKPNSLLKSPLLWVGASIAFLAHLFNGLNRYFPSVPHFRLWYSLAPFFPDRPWNALVQSWPLFVLIYFSVIGVTYFLQLDVALSLWFFFTFYKFQQVFFSAFSIKGISTQHQVMGGDIILIFFLLWMSKRHLRDVFRQVFSRREGTDDANEPLSYRFAVLGMGAGCAGILAMCQILGMSLWVSVFFIFLLWTMATIVAWMVANAGMLLVNVGFTPFWFMTTFFGSRKLGAANLTILGFDRSSIPHWSSESLMPYALQNFKLADSVELEKRRIPLLMTLAILVAVAAAFYGSLQFIYRQGAENLEYWIYTGVGRWSLQQANYAIQFPYGPNKTGIYSSLLGAGFMGFLLFMRYRFLWWPLHPIGYVVGVTYAPFHLWFSILAGWVIKVCVLKFGGLGAYRRYRPFFLGLIVGEYFMAALWSFIGVFTGIGYWGLPH